MKNKHSDLSERYLILFKLDAKNLFDRISTRRTDYIEAFSLKRNRAVFKEVFENRYYKATIEDLSHCPLEVIEVLNSFYIEVDHLYWYLKTTQDMPNTIEDEVTRKIAKISLLYDQVELFVDGELSGLDISLEKEAQKPSNIHDLEFSLEGERLESEAQEQFIQDEQYPELLEDE